MKREMIIKYEFSQREYEEIQEALSRIGCFLLKGNDERGAQQAYEKLHKYMNGDVK